MLDKDLINACLKHAEEDNKNGLPQNPNESINLLIKIVQLEQFTPHDIKAYLSKVCNNPMTTPVLEVLLAIIRLYSFERLQQIPHINNPQAFAVIKDLEDYLLQRITNLLLDNKENLVINQSKVALLMGYMKKRYYSLYFKLCKMFK